MAAAASSAGQQLATAHTYCLHTAATLFTILLQQVLVHVQLTMCIHLHTTEECNQQLAQRWLAEEDQTHPMLRQKPPHYHNHPVDTS